MIEKPQVRYAEKICSLLPPKLQSVYFLNSGSEAVEAFAARLTDFRTSKGAIQLPNDRELPLDLIAEIARWCWETNRA